MGKTNPTYRDCVNQFESDWDSYRRALRIEHKPYFDQLINEARNFADAGGIRNHQNPEITILFSMMLAQERRITELEKELRDREASTPN